MRRKNAPRAELRKSAHACQRHGSIHFVPQYCQRALNPGSSRCRNAVQSRAPQQDGISAERHGLDYV